MKHLLSLVALSLLTPPVWAQTKMPNYQEWQAACAKLPSNRQLNREKKDFPDKKLLPLPRFADFEAALDGFLLMTQQGPLGKPSSWVGSPPDFQTFFDKRRSWYGDNPVPFEPFAAKLTVAPDAQVIVMGDLHGDVRSLLKTLDALNARGLLDGFKLRTRKDHFIFLGDFTDRGHYGVEVMYTLFRLKMANPDQVHLGRGNHEDFNIVSRYGFLDELKGKYGEGADITKVMRAYDRMPVVLYAGTATDYLQMNHGGLEPGFDPRSLLASSGNLRFQRLGQLRQKAFHNRHTGWLGSKSDELDLAAKRLHDFTPTSPTKPHPIGFMWNDFSVFADDPLLSYGRSLIFGPRPTKTVLAAASTDRVRVRAVFRAHQHSGSLNPLMSRLVACDGLFRHWHPSETTADKSKTVSDLRKALQPEQFRPIPDGSVWTFNVSPDSSYGAGCGFDSATAGILQVFPDFAKWRIRALNVPVF